MRKSTFLFLLAGLLAEVLHAQNPTATEYGNMITSAGIRDHLAILASDAMEGRETGTRGQKMAAAFIAAHFEELGLLPPVNGSYYQKFEMYSPAPGKSYLKSGTDIFENMKDIAYFSDTESVDEVKLPVVFVGKGTEADFAQVNVEGKAVVRLVTEQSVNASDIAYLAKQKGATMVLMVGDNDQKFQDYVTQIQRTTARGGIKFEKPTFTVDKNGRMFIKQHVAEKILNTKMDQLVTAANADATTSPLKKLKAGSITYKTLMTYRTTKTENVLGYLEGTDKKDEVIVITAHYDHIGKRRSGEGDIISNGADDDASGTSAVMELARTFAKAKADGKGPRRSILFMTVTAEEKGLFGSQYYVTNPIFPLERTVVNLNIDMIGRTDAQHKDSGAYVYVIGANKLSTELHEISERINNQNTKLIFDYTYNDENHPDRLYYRSDHWNFAKNNVPIIFYFDGIHEDYHRVTDEIDKIEFDLLTKRAQCVFYTAWEIANRDKRIVPDVKKINNER